MKAVVLAYHNIGCVGIEALLRNCFEIAGVFFEDCAQFVDCLFVVSELVESAIHDLQSKCAALGFVDNSNAASPELDELVPAGQLLQ